MDSNYFSHDEEGYCGLSFDDFIEKFPNSNPQDVSTNEDYSNPYGYKVPSDISPLLKNVFRVAYLVLSSSKFINNTRRMFWGYFLGSYYQDSLLDLSNYIKECRREYWEKVEHHSKKNSIEKIQRLDPQIFHPLAPPENNPWVLSQKSKELMDVIWQDLERTYQERSLFRKDLVMKSLRRVLFVWSLEHDYISYKQGMNELLAVIYVVCYRDQAKACPHNGEEDYKYFKIIFSGDPKDIEADSYTLFNSFMTKDFQLIYDTSAASHFGWSRSSRNQENPLIARCNHIFNDVLKDFDLCLYSHLKEVGLEPHLFMIRWIRLLFSREFNLNESLNLWDFLLSDYFFEVTRDHITNFTIINYFSVAMIAFLKTNLVESDLNSCLQRLFKYPPIEDISILTKKCLQVKKKFLRDKTRGRDENGRYTGNPDQEVYHEACEYLEQLRPLPYPLTESSPDNSPKLVPIRMLDDSTFLDTPDNSSDFESLGSATATIDLKTELIELANKTQAIYEKALRNSSDDIFRGIKEVNSQIRKIINNIDSFSLII